MDRRDFIKLASTVGLGVVGASAFSTDSRAQEVYPGPFYLMINAGGGWDPTSFCDPKGAQSAAEENPMNHYLASEIATVGAFRLAPVPGVIEFFEAHQNELMVINGIDFATNSHDAGSRTAWAGTLVENKPAFAALVAGSYAPTQPMSFITYGGYDASAGVVAVTRVGNPDVLQRIAYPNAIGDPSENNGFHTQTAMDIITQARDARLQALTAKQQLPRLKQKMGMLYLARTGQNQLKQLTAFLPPDDELLDGLAGQAQIAIAAMRAGVCVAANLSMGNFDTHGDHDNQHLPQLEELFAGAGMAWDIAQSYAETQGRIRMVMASDFGRSPRYNDGNGKDHWSVSSMVMMGAGIPGGRVIGGSDEGHNPLTVNPQSLALDPSGIRITPGHVHRALRKLAGIDTNEIVARFPLKETEDLPLFA